MFAFSGFYIYKEVYCFWSYWQVSSGCSFFSFYFSLKFTCPSVLQSGQSSSEFRWIKSPLFLALLYVPIWIFFRLYSFLQNCLCFVVDCGWLIRLISFLLGYLQVLVWKCWKNFLFLCLCFLVHELCERTD